MFSKGRVAGGGGRRRPLVQPVRKNGSDRNAAAEPASPPPDQAEPVSTIAREGASVALPRANGSGIREAMDLVRPAVIEQFALIDPQVVSKAEFTQQVDEITGEVLSAAGIRLASDDRGNLVTEMVGEFLAKAAPTNPEANPDEAAKGNGAAAAESWAAPSPPSVPLDQRNAKPSSTASASRSSVEAAKATIQPKLMQRIDVSAAAQLPREALGKELSDLVVELLAEDKIQLNLAEQRELVTALLNDMLGLGPLEPLLDDEAITDIMVNGP